MFPWLHATIIAVVNPYFSLCVGLYLHYSGVSLPLISNKIATVYPLSFYSYGSWFHSLGGITLFFDNSMATVSLCLFYNIELCSNYLGGIMPLIAKYIVNVILIPFSYHYLFVCTVLISILYLIQYYSNK